MSPGHLDCEQSWMSCASARTCLESDHMRTLGGSKPIQCREVRFGTSRTSAVDGPMFLAASVDAPSRLIPRSAGSSCATSG
ncbi:hypothetical protein AQI70_36530 [Streptomyces curacoi]|uniref:Uncharacterized protein n=1 Tax=Streptomyces curacoi TaxID=146536 RepID=A0A117NTJ1_9ACTN|nr:hypothetical protein AQI70_36530 [Streptomyces curacoi]